MAEAVSRRKALAITASIGTSLAAGAAVAKPPPSIPAITAELAQVLQLQHGGAWRVTSDPEHDFILIHRVR